MSPKWEGTVGLCIGLEVNQMGLMHQFAPTYDAVFRLKLAGNSLKKTGHGPRALFANCC